MKNYLKNSRNSKSPTQKNNSFFIPNQNIFSTQISNLIQSFILKTKESVGLHQILFKNNLPQRCLKHNNILTLYCQKDRFPICVNCMYHGTDHKNHKVVPLKNASRLLLTDTQNLQNKLKRKIQWIQQIIRISTENIVKVERIYPEILKKIEGNFKTIYKFIAQKQQQQIKQLYYISQNLRNNHLVIVNQYTKLLQYFQDRTSNNNFQDQQTNIFKRNILTIMTQSSKILNINVKSLDYTNYTNSFNLNGLKELQLILSQKLQIKQFPQIISFTQNIPQIKNQQIPKSRIISQNLTPKNRNFKQQQFIKNQQSISRYPLELSINTNSINRYNHERQNLKYDEKTPSHSGTPRTSKTPLKRSLKLQQQ